jgi:cation diffusion facilitator CzcD-associated flavoprotein CzcO
VQPNVNPVFGEIKKATKKGLITTNGIEHDIDILVCATGFNVAFKPVFKVINGEGKSIQEDWGDGVNLYFGVSAPRWVV